MADKTTYMYVSYTLIRKECYEDDDESWTDEVHVANEIKSWHTDLDFEVDDMHIKTFIEVGKKYYVKGDDND